MPTLLRKWWSIDAQRFVVSPTIHYENQHLSKFIAVTKNVFWSTLNWSEISHEMYFISKTSYVHNKKQPNQIDILVWMMLSMKPRDIQHSYADFIFLIACFRTYCRLYWRFRLFIWFEFDAVYFERHCVKCGNGQMLTVTTRRVNRIFTTCQPYIKSIYKVYAIFNFPRFSLGTDFSQSTSHSFLLFSCHSLSTHHWLLVWFFPSRRRNEYVYL